MKTAVEWLIEKLGIEGIIWLQEEIEQAKEMEKQQIEKSFSDGAQWELYGCDLTHQERAEQYYNETFKQEQ